ncbi:unnamed protein product, partial [Mesorhabditis belari]|uniref:Uncharacterized protein n=1 Tax=Mesorhabditis belari TaxID=2138241 RepID=A0AAF3J2B6_9BILA
MIHVFNHPIEPTSLDEFHQEKDGQEGLFDVNIKRRKEVKYLADGRKEINGDLQEKKAPNELWRTTITRGMAQEWRERAEGGRLQQARIYLREMAYNVLGCLTNLGTSLKAFHPPSSSMTTLLLVALNIFLVLGLLRIMKIL